MTFLTRRSLIFASLALAMEEREFAALAQEETAASPQIPIYRGNAARTGEHPGPGPAGQPRALWDIRLGTNITSSPAFVGDVLYVGSAAPSTLAGGALHAVEASSGRGLWRLSTATGDAIFSSPAVVDGFVYAGSYDGIFVAADALTGIERWRYQTEGAIYSSPVAENGLAFVGDSAGRLYALDIAVGQERWRFDVAEPFRRSMNASPALLDDLLFIVATGRHTDEPSELYALGSDSGQEHWRFSAEEGGRVRGTVACAANQIHVATEKGSLLALDPHDGRKLWELNGGAPTQSLMAVSEGIITFAVEGGLLLGVDAATGELLWTTRLEAGAEITSAPVIATGMIYAGDSRGMIHGLDLASGEERWSANVGTLASSPAVIGGAIYVGTDDGILGAVVGVDGGERQPGEGCRAR